VVVGNVADRSANERASIAGDTPNLAVRLQGAAAPGQIVVADSTRRLAGQSFDIESLGAKKLKGFTSPIALFEVRVEREVESRFEAAHASGLSKFVGRAARSACCTNGGSWRRPARSICKGLSMSSSGCNVRPIT
jgi:hypothetical protein